MKHSLKIGLSALIITCLIYTGCKKADLQPLNQSVKTQADQKAIASRIANDFFKTYSSQSGKNNLKTSANGLGVMSTPQCGDFTITPFDQSFMRNDTSFTLKGKSIFTFTCSPNSSGPDGYTFADTMRTSESGKGFANIFEGFQKYNVINIANANVYGIKGELHAWARYATVGNKGITEQHDFSTEYELDGNGAVTTQDSPATLAAQVGFRCSITHVYPFSSEKNESIRYAGIMDIQKDVISSYFYVEGETYFMKYELDPVSKKIISGPTKAYYTNK